MPTSRTGHIPLVIGIVRHLGATSILDVGTGFGKWGVLFREYTDVRMAEKDPNRYERAHWKTRIDGIEGFTPYLTPVHEYVYNRIYVGDMREMIGQVGRYDVVFLGDVIEHVDVDDGVNLLTACLDHAKQAVVVATPAKETGQSVAVCGNEMEIHRSLWTADRFETVAPSLTTTTQDDVLVAVLPKQGVDAAALEAAMQRKRT